MTRVTRVTRAETSVGPGAWAILVFATAALFLSCGRAETPTPKPALDPQSSAVESDDVGSRSRRSLDEPHPVIWLGLDGIDWEVLDRLSSEGKMPNWTRLVAE